MSAVEETSSESVDVKEDKDLDVEPEDNHGDDFLLDPTRYLFYRYDSVF